MVSRKIPSQLGCWKIGDEIGRGGMGTVYKAVSTKDGQVVAIKVLSFDLVNDLEYLKRFRREIKAGQSVSSPNVVKVIEWGEENGCYYFAMELLEGGKDLHQVLQEEGALNEDRTLEIGIGLCSALAALHKSSVVHRDIKPGNIMLLPDGTIKLMDLGLARILDRTALTVTGEALGSPRYMAPEILSGKVADFRSDVYQAGVLLYELLAGEPAFDGDNFERLLQIIIADPPVDIRIKAPDISPALAGIIDVCLCKNPDDRYMGVEKLKTELENVRDGEWDSLTDDSSGSGDGTLFVTSAVEDNSEDNALRASSFLQEPPSAESRFRQFYSEQRNFVLLFASLLLFAGGILFYFWLPKAVLPVDPEVSVLQGLKVVEIRWNTAVDCQTQAKVAADNMPVRSFRNESEKAVKKHRILLSDLPLGKKYRLRLYGVKESEGCSFVRFSEINPTDFQINRSGDVVSVKALLPSWVKPALSVVALGETFSGVEASASYGKDAGPVKRVASINGIPAYSEISSITLTCRDSFGDSVVFQLPSLPGTVSMLIASQIDGVPLPSAVEAFVGESNSFFADPSIVYERKKKVYDLLVAGAVTPTLLAPFVRWSEFSGSVEAKGFYKPVSLSMPVVMVKNPFSSLASPLSAAALKSGQLFVFKLDSPVEPQSDVALIISRTGVGEGARLRIIVGDNFQIVDGDFFRNNKLFKVVFPGVCLSGRKLVIVRVIAESLGYQNEDAEKMILEKLFFSVSRH
jgi:serine/threonine protein kinase